MCSVPLATTIDVRQGNPMNKLIAPLTACLIAFGLHSQAAWSDSNGVPGFLGADGSFHLLPRPSVIAGATTTKVTGTLTMTLTVSIVSTVAAATPVRCTFNATVIGYNVTTGVGDTIAETDSVAATRSGATATCNLTIPYEWTLQVTTDTVSIGYSVSTLDANSDGRLTTASVATIPLPKTGATTHFAVAARI
jgi:hypothetical protein